MYLPQFHETEDNNKWWGQGYTEWNAVKGSKKYFNKHMQPRVPLNNNYYDLSLESGEVLRWQAKLARKYGIYGFCIYHYWFGGKKELERPAEILLACKDIDINYSFCWDGATWRRTWYTTEYESEILIQQDYGQVEMWRKHFNDLLPYFKDERYIKKDNKPVFHIYHASDMTCLVEMKDCWNTLAKENGFKGIYFVVGDFKGRELAHVKEAADAYYNFEPNHAFYEGRYKHYVINSVARAGVIKRINKWFNKKFLPDIRDAKGMYKLIEQVSKKQKGSKKEFLGIFPDYDDTPRRQLKGVVYSNNKIEYFKKCLRAQLKESLQRNNEFLYINAWNEWGESAYLEPDDVHGYDYLETIRQVLNEEIG